MKNNAFNHTPPLNFVVEGDVLLLLFFLFIYLCFNANFRSLPADVLWGSFVTHSFLPYGRRPLGRNECVTNEPHRTSAGRL